jgi:hypothetical protein
MTVPVQPGRDQARAWAVNELSRREYQAAKPSLLERALHWIADKLGQIRFGADTPVTLGLGVLAVIVIAVIVFVLYRTGGFHRTAQRPTSGVLPDRPTTAAQHRDRADRHAAAQEWGQAVVERFRAIARELEERALLTPQAGRTALEVAQDAGRALPELAADLVAAAHSFDDVSYGHLDVGPEADQALRALDGRLAAARPVAVV